MLDDEERWIRYAERALELLNHDVMWQGIIEACKILKYPELSEIHRDYFEALEFCLMASDDDADYRVKLTDAYLKIRKVKVSPSITMAHKIALKKGPAIYQMRRVECKSFIIPARNPSLIKDNVSSGLVQKTFVFGLVESEAFNGAYKKNPYNFQHFNMSSVGLTVNGESMPFKPNSTFA